MIVCAVISIGFLVFIHEGGHYLAARAFGVRVTEFMLGLPGPSIGFTKGETRYGVTAVPLGGYAKVCGMEAGPLQPHLQEVGQAREVADPHALYESEYRQQYRSLPFWKRSVILLAGIFMNLLFAMLVFIIVFSIIGFQVQHPETGEITTIHASVLQALQAGFMYIGMVIQAVAGLFNPATAAQTVSDSTSIVGIAVMSKDYFQAGLVEALEFMAMISVSLGIMNLLPIPPLDGGRFVVEIFQKGTRKTVSQKAMNYMSLAGMALFLGFFVIMLNQDIQRFVFGNWG